MKEATESTTRALNMKVEHLFGPRNTSTSESLKIFIEEHPEIVFDFAILGSMGVHGETDKGYASSKIATSMLNMSCLNVVLIP